MPLFVRADDFANQHIRIIDRTIGHSQLLCLAAAGLKQEDPDAAAGLDQIGLDLVKDSREMRELLSLVQCAIRSGHLAGVIPVPAYQAPPEDS